MSFHFLMHILKVMIVSLPDDEGDQVWRHDRLLCPESGEKTLVVSQGSQQTLTASDQVGQVGRTGLQKEKRVSFLCQFIRQSNVIEFLCSAFIIQCSTLDQ